MSGLFAGTKFDQRPPCAKCGKSSANCRCIELPEKRKMSASSKGPQALDSGLVLTPENSIAPKDQQAKVRVEKRPGGRVSTVVTGLEHPANDLAKLCADLKQGLSVGGSIQGRTVEIQGDQAKKVTELLVAKGFKARVVS